MSAVITAMYIHAPQGRVEGLCTVSYKDFVDMLTLVETEQRPAAALSNTFKTYAKYGYQPVVIPVSVVDALLVYVSLRPRPRTDETPFFLDSNGNSYSSSAVSKLVTGFFKKHLGLHVTTTMIRSLCEIMTSKALDEGLITGIPAFYLVITTYNPKSNHSLTLTLRYVY